MTSSPALGVRLFLTSATILFVELLLIRWIPANVPYIGFFNNFVLLASFLGIGLGILVGRRWSRSSLVLFGPLLLAITLVIHATRVDLGGPDVFFGASERPQLKIDLAVLVLIVVLVTGAMAALAMPLGPLLRGMPPLRAYAIDIGGSMAGIAAFSALALAQAGPAAWLAIVLALVVALDLARGPRRSTYLAVGTVAAALGFTVAVDRGDIWSPYYRVDIYRGQGPVGLTVNGIPHQNMWPIGSTLKEPYFEQIYGWVPGRRFDRVLVVGAGTGTDVAIALARGAGAVEAVEIDPAIQEIGRAMHPDRPYADPRVHVTIADGRAFLRSSDARFDLVIFGATDSLTLVTSTANLRLESFLFTEEAFASVRDHLTPSGVFVLYNWYREPWLVERYAGMLQRVFAQPPAVLVDPAAVDVQAATLAAGPGIAGRSLPRVTPGEDGVHDDAPFPYLRVRAIPGSGLSALAAIVLLAAAAVGLAMRAARTSLDRSSLHFFLLGVAFLLLETKSLVTFSLLFGTTWVVNAFVFFAILASVLAAIAVSARFPQRDPRWVYSGLLASLAVGYLLPPSELLLEPAGLRYAVASAVTFAPVFFANLAFATAFRGSRAADVAFAANLLGAMIGGAIEWSAVVVGYRALALVVAALYAAAYVTSSAFPFRAARSTLARAPSARG